ncbi:uncharacterized protein PFLUO_LOCUS4193 [Penicillium psychrofluorescens]|uniref:uncharacterized protein n=1 Tax=Penicillium psychrofluorescens TaxID=3158075 RepID=UPI003CCD206E
MVTNSPRVPTKRRDSAASEQDFFDIPDESCLAVIKRQLRHIRTWVLFAVLALFFLWSWRKGPPPPPAPIPHINYNKVDWSRFAYTQYATSSTYLCNALMVFEALHRYGSRADRVLFYPQDWDLVVSDDNDRTSQLLMLAKEKYNVRVVPVSIEGLKKPDQEAAQESWDKSISKFFAFAEVAYDRIIQLDSDVTLLQNLDELFFLPSAPVAMPRAYWLLPEWQLSSLLIVLEPSFTEYYALKNLALAAAHGQLKLDSTSNRYDMDLLNSRYADSALVLPHRQYGLITGEFRAKDHGHYLGNDRDEWDPEKASDEAAFVHFSNDWKPWVMWSTDELADSQPRCKFFSGTPQESGCENRVAWKKLYDDFRKRRKEVCRLLSFPAHN